MPNLIKTCRRLLLAILTMGLTLLLTGCKWALFDPKGVTAASEKQLIVDAALLMLLIVVPVIIMSWVFAWWYRASNTKATYKPNSAHNNIIEFFCWLVPCIIILVLGIMTWRSTHELDPYRPLNDPREPIKIQVISLDWKWMFIYPDQNIATINELTFPVNTPVRFFITSDAPMNSFDIPQLTGQIYSMGGMQTQMNTMATEIGDYMGQSTNISGEGFSGMHFVVHVTSQADYEQWIKKVQTSPNKLTITVYNKLTEPTSNDPVQYFSGVAPDLFHNVIMKFMMPDPNFEIPNDGTEVLTLRHKNV